MGTCLIRISLDAKDVNLFRVGENSPSLCPIISSVIVTGMYSMPLCTKNFNLYIRFGLSEVEIPHEFREYCARPSLCSDRDFLCEGLSEIDREVDNMRTYPDISAITVDSRYQPFHFERPRRAGIDILMMQNLLWQVDCTTVV